MNKRWVCLECDKDTADSPTISIGDEYWRLCPNCRTLEGKWRYEEGCACNPNGDDDGDAECVCKGKGWWEDGVLPDVLRVAGAAADGK